MMNNQMENEQRHFIGIDIGGTKTAVSAGDCLGNIIGKIKFETKKNPNEVIKDIFKAVVTVSQPFGGVFESIGICCGGPLNIEKGLIQSPPNLPNWIDIPIVKILSDTFNVPTFLQNDANACALAEWRWGNGQGSNHMVFLTFGTGMGAGLILNGKLFEGRSGLAGEVGHIRLADSGSFGYGKIGSWEGFCSGNGMSYLYKDRFGKDKTAKEICELAEKGDVQARTITDLSAYYLGHGIALLIDILNPEIIVIGSIFTRSENLFRPTMEKVLQKEALTHSFEVCKIAPSLLGELLGDKAALSVAMINDLEVD